MAAADAMPVPSSSFDFAPLLREGDVVSWPQGPGEPLGLTGRLMAVRHQLPKARLLLGLLTQTSAAPAVTDRFDVTCLNGAGDARKLTALPGTRIMPTHVSEMPGLISSGLLRVDVVLIRVRATPEAGIYSLGVMADWVQDLVAMARVVVAEIDPRLPLTGGDALLAAERVTHFTEADAGEVLMPDPTPSDTDRAIAARVAELIPNGATVQFGIGGLPTAVCAALAGHRNLGIHSGIITDAAVDLLEAGVVTNSEKGVDLGLTVTGGLFGSRRLLDHADGNAAIVLRSARYTHSHAVLSGLRRLHAVNSAVSVDLTGQVNSEVAAGRYVGAVGGQVDFMRGARASEGGRAILAFASTTADGKHSKIVPTLEGAPVSTARTDIDLVVTEQGVADLRGLDLEARSRALIAVAHPAFREHLERAPKTVGHAAAPATREARS